MAKVRVQIPLSRFVLVRGQGNIDEPVRFLLEALELQPNNADAHNLGAIFARRGSLTEAVAEFESALAIDPQHLVARKNLELARTRLKTIQ